MTPPLRAALSIMAAALSAALAAQAMSSMHRADVAYRAAQSAVVPPRFRTDRGTILTTPSPSAAETALIGMIGDRAADAGLRVTITPESAVGATAVRVTLVAQGSEQAIVRFATSLENGQPLVRLARWSIDGQSGRVRLTAEIVAPWNRS